MKNSIARELVERNGVDAQQLLDLLVRTAIAELSNYYYYTLLKVNLVGVEGEALKKIVEDARQEDLNHFQALVPRIYELGGRLPANPADFSAPGENALGAVLDGTDVRAILEQLLRSAEYSVRTYTQLCNLTCGKDNRTYSLALAILHEEIEHQVWYLDFLGHGANEPVGRERRSGSPFVTKFLQSAVRPVVAIERRRSERTFS